jgi:hypothetical protein
MRKNDRETEFEIKRTFDFDKTKSSLMIRLFEMAMKFEQLIYRENET